MVAEAGAGPGAPPPAGAPPAQPVPGPPQPQGDEDADMEVEDTQEPMRIVRNYQRQDPRRARAWLPPSLHARSMPLAWRGTAAAAASAVQAAWPAAPMTGRSAALMLALREPAASGCVQLCAAAAAQCRRALHSSNDMCPCLTPCCACRQRDSDAGKYVKSPITGELIEVAQMAEHMRISLIDPKWRVQREAMLAKIRETTKASDDEIGRNLVGLARHRPDVFGVPCCCREAVSSGACWQVPQVPGSHRALSVQLRQPRLDGPEPSVQVVRDRPQSRPVLLLPWG